MTTNVQKKTQKTQFYKQEISKNHENNLTGKQVVLLIPLTKFFAQKENITKLKDIIDGRSKLSLRLIDWFVTNYSKKNYIMYNLTKIRDLNKSKSKKESKQENQLKEKLNNKTYNLDHKSSTINNTNLNNDNLDNDNIDNLLFFPSNVKKQNCENSNEQELFSDYFNVFNDYRAQLKSLNKRNFDPFCRRSRIKFYYGKSNDDFIITTVGQLNFFKWAIENYILEYIEYNLKTIDEDMNNNIDIKKYNDKTKKKKQHNTNSNTNTTTNKNKNVKNNKNNKNIKQKNNKNEENSNQKSTRRKRKELSISASKSFMIHNVKAVIEFS